MSEENKQNDQPEVSFGFIGKEDGIFIEFADGVRQIPDYVIQGLGGADSLKNLAPALKEKTYAEFLAGFRKVVEKRELNRFQQNFVSNHFGKLF